MGLCSAVYHPAFSRRKGLIQATGISRYTRTSADDPGERCGRICRIQRILEGQLIDGDFTPASQPSWPIVQDIFSIRVDRKCDVSASNECCFPVCRRSEE